MSKKLFLLHRLNDSNFKTIIEEEKMLRKTDQLFIFEGENSKSRSQQNVLQLCIAYRQLLLLTLNTQNTTNTLVGEHNIRGASSTSNTV